jgi:N-acetylglucosamine kinase-like BadF-type ATPase
VTTDCVYVGIDGGGTHARAVVVDGHGRELARGTGPAGIVRATDPQAAADAAAELTRSVLAEAGITADSVVLCCGLAGAGRPPEREAVRVALVLSGVVDRALVVGDAEAALEDAFAADTGILVIAGTGSIAWARSVDGRVVRVGGWGLLLGDEGSGYALGLDGLKAVTRAADGRDLPTGLTEPVLRATGCASANDLIRFGAGATKAQVASLAPVVLEQAAAGDPAAAAIRDRAVAELARLARTAARQAGLQTPPCALAGGLIAPGGPLRDALAHTLAATLPGCTIRDAPVDAARGAAMLAMRSA